MKLLLLKVLLQRRARDEGFTLPLVIGLGLVMTLLGTINLTSANEEKLNAITQNSRSDALAIAEIGVARYRQLLDRNRILVINDDTAWAGLVNATTGEAEFCDANILSNFVAGQSNDITINEDGQDLNNNGASNDIFTTGSYQLVSYDYQGAANFDVTNDSANNDPVTGDPAKGTLTVRGTTPDGGNAQIVVDIPIRINTSDMDNLAPALWVADNTISAADLGTLNIDDNSGNNGNVIIADRAIISGGSYTDGCDDFATLASSTNLPIISDARTMPAISDIVTTVDTDAGSQINTSIANYVGTPGEKAFVKPPVGQTFVESTHCADIRDCRYYYDLGATSIRRSVYSQVRADGIAKVTFLIDGTLEIAADGGNLSVGSDVASNYFEIYVKPDAAGNSDDITIATNGNNITIDAFIHAPESTLTITGSGTVTINGAVWVKDFINSSGATVNITPDTSSISSSSSDKAYKFYTTTTSRTPKPITERPSDWRTEQAN